MSVCVEGRGVVSFLVICTCLLAMKDFLMGTNIRRGRFFSIYPSICLCMCPSPNTFPSSSFTGIISFFVYLLNPLPPSSSLFPSSSSPLAPLLCSSSLPFLLLLPVAVLRAEELLLVFSFPEPLLDTEPPSSLGNLL